MNPLLMPEILEHLGCFVPAWTSTPCYGNSYIYRFSPQDLLACSLVSHTWHRIFYPRLWTVYDSEVMSSSRCNVDYGNKSPREYFLIPEELLIAQSPNFRIITNFIPRFSGILQCRQLEDLTLHRACARSLYLVNTNPTLKRLTWFGSIPYSGLLSDLESDSMSNLVCLEELSLQQWDVSENKLVPILRRNCKALRKLSLKSIQGFDSIINPTPVSDLELQDISKESEGVATFQAPLVLEQLEELTVDCEWTENPGLLDLITKYCPRVRTLHLGESLVDDTVMMNRFEDRLKESRSLLRKEERRNSASGIRYCQGT